MIDFKPSQVTLGAIPFINTFDRTESECTAAVIVKALAIRGDTWRLIACRELAEVFDDLTKMPGHWRDLFGNPLIRIDMHGLVDRGYAEWSEDGKAIEFTEKGLVRMSKWVKLTVGR